MSSNREQKEVGAFLTLLRSQPRRDERQTRIKYLLRARLWAKHFVHSTFVYSHNPLRLKYYYFYFTGKKINLSEIAKL